MKWLKRLFIREKRYIVFSYSEYYPCGGLGDVAGSFRRKKNAIEAAKKQGGDFVYVYDSHTMLIVWDRDDKNSSYQPFKE